MLKQKPQANSSEFAYWRFAKRGIFFLLLINTPATFAIPQTSSFSEVPFETSAPLSVERHLVSSGFEVSHNRTIDTIVLHSAYNPFRGDRYSVPAVLNIFRSERVASHYLIDRSGRIYQLVEEQNIAFHAGISRWQERTRLNRFSIGIELLNHPADSYTEAQYQALNRLLLDIRARHRIRTIVGHREIAPNRRSDPWNFNWSRIASFQAS